MGEGFRGVFKLGEDAKYQYQGRSENRHPMGHLPSPSFKNRFLGYYWPKTGFVQAFAQVASRYLSPPPSV